MFWEIKYKSIGAIVGPLFESTYLVEGSFHSHLAK